MRKVKLLVVAFSAVLAFGAISVASASASPEWLESGAKIISAQSAVTEGTWKLRGLGIFGIEIEVSCNGELIGSVGPGAVDLVTSVTDLNGNTTLDCTILKESIAKTCLTKLALVKAEHLNWATELLLPKTGEWIDHFRGHGSGLPAFKVECELTPGKFTEELCEGEILTGPLTNDTTDVLGTITEQLSSKCNKPGNVAHISGSGLTKLLGSATLAVS